MLTIILWPAFVRWSIKSKKGHNVDVPHPINSSKKRRGVFQTMLIVPFPLSFGHLNWKIINY